MERFIPANRGVCGHFLFEKEETGAGTVCRIFIFQLEKLGER